MQVGVQMTFQSWGCDGHVGDHDLTCCFRHAGLPYDRGEASMRRFATDVLPLVTSEPALR